MEWNFSERRSEEVIMFHLTLSVAMTDHQVGNCLVYLCLDEWLQRHLPEAHSSKSWVSEIPLVLPSGVCVRVEDTCIREII